jgi:hypothetical protein
MDIKLTKIFYAKAFKNMQKLGFFGLKIYRLATLQLSGN